MNTSFRRALAAFAASLATLAAAQAFPSKPVRIIVPFAPGGNVDVTARIIAPALQEALGQPVVIENKAGAAGTIGADQVVRAPADGYTLLMGSNSTFSVAPSLNPKNPYNPVKDFAPVASIAATPFILVVNPAAPMKSVPELVARAKGAPGKLTMASAGTGSSNHLVGELFQDMTGVKFTHVPYKGSNPAISDLMGGQVDMHFDQVTSAGNHVQSGKLRALLVTSKERAPMLPDVPTAAEVGYASFGPINVTGLIAPAGTPREVIAILNAATNKALQQAAVREKYAGVGAVTTGGTPEQFAAYIAEDLARWTKVVKDANVKVD
jgi:tripartite-type tricarboxylate transporter receptor subunit TctC